MSQNVGFIAAALATGVGAKVVDLPTAFAGLLAVGVFGVCMGVSNFLKVDVPKIAPKAKKISKKEKKAAAAAAAKEANAESDAAAEEAAAAKAAKKREKERARKVAKKAAAARLAEEQAQEAEQKAAEAAQEKAQEKKQKKKKNKKKKNAERKVSEAEVEAKIVETAEPVVEDVVDTNVGWNEIKRKTKKVVPVFVKADDETADEEEVKAPEPTKFSRFMNVEENKRSVLIGAGGSTIQKIQQQHGVKIDLPDRGTSEPVVITSENEDNIVAAMATMKELITKGYSAITHENWTKVQIQVARVNLPMLFGQGGSTIRALQVETGTKIDVPRNNDPIVVVNVTGEAEKVAECQDRIAKLLIPAPAKPVPEEWTQAASMHYLDAW